jgi:predicted hydrocarbon binding protein
MDTEKNIKGIHIINVIDFVKNKRGQIGLNMLFERINEDKPKPKKLSVNGFIEKEWYPYELYLEFLATADDVTGNGSLMRCYEIGFQTIQHMGHLSYLTRAPDIHELMDKAQENWGRVYDFGNIEIVEKSDNKIILRYHGFPKSKAKCEYFKGSLAGTIELSKLKGKVKETACNMEGASWCEFELTWE